MADLGLILVADGDEAFRMATCRLLEQEGFTCQVAGDGEEAIECLRRTRFDLLVSEVEMPHNEDLRLVRNARAMDSRLSIILVANRPTLETAIDSVDLAVMAYLPKPVDRMELIPRAWSAIKYSRSDRLLSAVRRRLSACQSDLAAIQTERFSSHGQANEPVTVATIRTLASCLSELLELSDQSDSSWGAESLCELLDCPQRATHRRAIVKTVQILKETKDVFKSKKLAGLRIELERLIDASGIAGKSIASTGKKPKSIRQWRIQAGGQHV